ncbi:MAG: DMT family transporter [Anaerolineae bacterium]|nr:DMT family transporter [Anaerolineae bacterium]
MPLLGEFSALFTSFCWAMSAVGFSNATSVLGSQVTNRLRVVLALIALIVINTVLYGKPIPFDAGLERWGWLTLSGVIGLALGDAFLFSSYRHIGPRLGLLLLSLAPVFSAVIAWGLFGETLTFMQMLGIAVTLGGISWVVLVRGEENGQSQHDWRKGILFGILAALGQAAGLVLSKQGMGDNFSPFAATLIRMIAAVASLWIVALFQGQAVKTVQTVIANPKGLRWAIFGAFFGPVFGVSASLLAVQHTAVGVASTIMALPPVVMLPISYFFYKEKLNWQSILGTLVAIGGVALLFLR